MKRKAKWETTAIVIGVVDGDTFRCRLDLGWRIQLDTSVRVKGINAPELGTPGGEGAKNYLATILLPGMLLTIISRRLDKYGRSEADVRTATVPDLATLLLTARTVVRVRR
jgi:endonuclease YncB( thermonuclease family)